MILYLTIKKMFSLDTMAKIVMLIFYQKTYRMKKNTNRRRIKRLCALKGTTTTTTTSIVRQR